MKTRAEHLIFTLVGAVANAVQFRAVSIRTEIDRKGGTVKIVHADPGLCTVVAATGWNMPVIYTNGLEFKITSWGPIIDNQKMLGMVVEDEKGDMYLTYPNQQPNRWFLEGEMKMGPQLTSLMVRPLVPGVWVVTECFSDDTFKENRFDRQTELEEFIAEKVAANPDVDVIR